MSGIFQYERCGWPASHTGGQMGYNMGVQTFYGKGPRPLTWATFRAAREQITLSGIPNRLNYCVIL